MDEIGGYFLFPLIYLTMTTSGLPPGLGSTDLNSVLTSTQASQEMAKNLTTFPFHQNLSNTLDSMKFLHEPTTETSTPELNLNDKEKRMSVTNSIDSNDTSHHHHGDDMLNSTTDTPINAPLIQNITKVPLRGKCNNTNQCFGNFVECSVSVCKCSPGYLPRQDNGDLCGDERLHHVDLPQADPTMIGVVIGLALMSVTLCVVLRLFAKARFRENRTIFNTPNPRLMNVSLLKGSKALLRGNSAPRSRRGSTASGRSDVGTPTSPVADPTLVTHNQFDNGIPLAGSSSRPIKPQRQVSSDTGGGGHKG